MALTVTSITATRYVEDRKVVEGTIAFDSSYPTGGEAFPLASVGMTTCKRLTVQPTSGYVFNWNRSEPTPLILARYADYDAVADGALIQVPDTTDLSSVTGVFFTIEGY